MYRHSAITIVSLVKKSGLILQNPLAFLALARVVLLKHIGCESRALFTSHPDPVCFFPFRAILLPVSTS